MNELKVAEPDAVADSINLVDAAAVVRDKYTDYPAFVPSGTNLITEPAVIVQEICQDSDDVKQAADLLKADVDAANND